MFFQIDLEKNSSAPEGAVFSRPDVLSQVWAAVLLPPVNQKIEVNPVNSMYF